MSKAWKSPQTEGAPKRQEEAERTKAWRSRPTEQRNARKVQRRSRRKDQRVAQQQPALRKRRSNGQQILKIQEKGEAAKTLQLLGQQGPVEEVQEGPGGR